MSEKKKVKGIPKKKLVDIEKYYLGSPSITLKDVAEKFNLNAGTIRNYSSKYGLAQKKVKMYGRIFKEGAKSQYLIEYDQQLIDFMGKGYSFQAFASEIDVSIETIKNWKKKYDTFFEAYKKGKAKQRKFYESTGIKGMYGELEKFNAAVWIFSTKQHLKWTDRVATDQKIKTKYQETISEESALRIASKMAEGRKARSDYWKKKYKELEEKTKTKNNDK
jgi:hypothetical protein